MTVVESNKPFDLAEIIVRLRRADVVLVGAGLSYAATRGGSPLMGTYFDQLSSAKYPLLAEFLAEHFGSFEAANVEEALLAIEQMRHSPLGMSEGFPDPRLWSCCVFEHELGAYTIDRFRSCRPWDDSLPYLALNLIRRNSTVVTTNYDTMAESILSKRPGTTHGVSGNCPHCKMRALLAKSCGCEAEDELTKADWQGTILKLHGSIAWKRCASDVCCYYDCLDADARCRAFTPCNCHSCGSECNPVLVMPSAAKDLSSFPGLSAVWNATSYAIREAKHVFVYGFSLPTTDCLIALWLKRAIAQGGVLRSITILDANPSPVVDRFKRMIGLNSDVEVMGMHAPSLAARFPRIVQTPVRSALRSSKERVRR